MNIKILGTRGEISESAPYHSKQSGILVDGELMLDLGEEEFLRYQPKNIMFTHLHPDHAFFVRSPQKAPEIDIPMYGPESYARGDIRVRKFGGSGRIGRYHVRAVPTIHSLKVESNALIVSRGKRKFLYTGDMVWIKKWYHRYFKGLDLVISEGSFIRKSGMVRRDKNTGNIYGHAGIGRLVGTFADYTGRIVLVHFGSWLYKDMEEAHRKVKEIADREGVEVTVGYDGMEITI
jgi:ribonuclease BN (tRNA processing enzyme)